MKNQTSKIKPVTPKVKKRAGRPPLVCRTDNLARQVGQAIRSRREALGYTLDDASQRTGGLVSLQDWSSYEHGTQPRFFRLMAVCLVLGCEPVQLLPSAAASLFDSDYNTLDSDRICTIFQ